MVLVGVQPTLMQVPPTCSCSIKAVLRPARARAVESGPPACPAPMTTASYSCAGAIVSFLSICQDITIAIDRIVLARADSLHPTVKSAAGRPGVTWRDQGDAAQVRVRGAMPPLCFVRGDEIQDLRPGVGAGLREVGSPAVEEAVWRAGIGDHPMGDAGLIQFPVEPLHLLCRDARIGPAKEGEDGEFDLGGAIQKCASAPEIARHSGIEADHAVQANVLRAG